jgi:hypothetical protein
MKARARKVTPENTVAVSFSLMRYFRQTPIVGFFDCCNMTSLFGGISPLGVWLRQAGFLFHGQTIPADYAGCGA